MALAPAACHAANRTIAAMPNTVYEHLNERPREECRRRYGARLFSLVLHGSAARSTMRFGSDIDVLIVA